MIADLIIRIKNACAAQHEHVVVNASNINLGILNILQQEGFISSFEKIENTKSKVHVFQVFLKYVKIDSNNKKPSITGIKQISKPGLRVYSESNKIARVQNGLGVAIISTNGGLMTDKMARQNHLGGEVIMNIW